MLEGHSSPLIQVKKKKTLTHLPQKEVIEPSLLYSHPQAKANKELNNQSLPMYHHNSIAFVF